MGTSLGEFGLQFKTNKFDSFINGTVVLTSDSLTSHTQVNYKFENGKKENLMLYFKFKDQSSKLRTALVSGFQIQSSAYPEMDMELNLNFQVSTYAIILK
jgi:hypothetical protein